MKKLLTLISVVMLSACGGDGPQLDTSPAGIRDMGDNFQVQLNIRDAAALAAIYAADGSIMPPNAETITGTAAIEASWVETLATGNIINLRESEVRVSGNIGYRVGTFTVASPHNELVDRGKFIEVWHLTAGGWRLMYDIFNSDRPNPE